MLKRRPPADDSDQPTAASPAPTPQPPVPAAEAPQPAPAPEAPSPEEPPYDHHAAVMKRGAEVMGFDQEATTHRFILSHSGGAMRVTVNDPDDAQEAGRISMHLRNVAAQFARGDFSAPQQTHGQVPPGIRVMQQLRAKIIYTAHAIDGGGELIISSEDSRAIEAIHQFLRFQIQEHQ